MAEMCGNKRMVEIYGAIADLIRLLALQSMRNPMRMNDRLIPQHEAMLKALKSGDTSLATALLTIHLKESKQAALEGIKSTKDIDLNNVLSIS
jgi:DNA-binding GntR family transcriptional regulator